MKNLLIICLVASVVLVGCVNGGNQAVVSDGDQQPTEVVTTLSAEDIARIEAESAAAVQAAAEAEAKRIAEEEKKKAAAEAKRLADIKARTFFAKSNTVLYGDEALSQPADVKLANRTPLLTNGVVKDDAGELVAYKIEAVSGEAQTGFVAVGDVKASLAAFITKTYDNIDYGYFERKTYDGNPPVKVKALFLTEYTASKDSSLDALIAIANETEINAFVIDVKDDSGHLLFPAPSSQAVMPEAYENARMKDISGLMKKLKDNDIYAIARIVTFKSPQYAAKYRDRAVTRPNGSLYTKSDKIAWATAYDRQLWDYVLGICKDAADVGFNEIQFDYVRFPAVKPSIDKTLDYHNDLNETKPEVIHKFLRHAYQILSAKEVYVTADIFGWAGSAVGDEGIGQHWEAMANAVDYTAPMIYPSHYGFNNYGIRYPDTKPYATISATIQDILERTANLETQPLTRPWIQDFTATWLGRGRYIKYGAKELRAQIDALADNGVDQYMVWNPANRYHTAAFKKEADRE